MKLIRKITSSLLMLSFVATGIWGCGQEADRNNDQGAKVQNIKSAPLNNQESSGVLVRNDLALALNRMKGIRNANVLMHNGNVYVGVTNVGPEPKRDARMKTDSWKGNPYGTEQNPRSAKGMTVDQLAHEQPNNASTHSGPRSTSIGNISDATKRQIIDTVRANTPGTQNVYLTGELDATEKLSGYREFISRGGNMSTHMTDFQRFVRQAFPDVNHP